jgi:hypothetical protein
MDSLKILPHRLMILLDLEPLDTMSIDSVTLLAIVNILLQLVSKGSNKDYIENTVKEMR